MTPLTDSRVISPLVTDANWRAIRAHRERHCVRVMSAQHWDVVNLCDRALRDYSDHDAWQQAIAQIGGAL
jgi:hypothetical protein